MKSDMKTLRGRGFIEDLDISEHRLKSKEELIELMHNKEPWVRSAAVKMFSLTNNMNDIKHANLILSCIVNEKKLYTRMEMGKALERGEQLTL